MRRADHVLDDAGLLEAVYEAQEKRRPKNRCHGRKQTPAEVVLLVAVLKHPAGLELRDTGQCRVLEFTRIGAEKVPDARTLGRLVQDLASVVIQQLHQQLVAVSRQRLKVFRGRKLRVDT